MQKYFLYLWVLVCAWQLSPGTAFALSANKPVITIAADSWCPINCGRGELGEGVGIDLARAIFEPLGYRINYRIISWDDALEEVRAGRVQAVVGASVADEPKLIFPSSPILNAYDNFYVLKGVTWRFNTMEDLKKKKLGVIKGYAYGKAVMDYIAANRNFQGAIQEVEGDNALIKNIRKLQNREIDVIVESKPVMEYMLAKQRLEDQIVWAGGQQLSSADNKVYLAFSPALPESRALAKAYDDGIRRLQSSGQLAAFYSKYGLRP